LNMGCFAPFSPRVHCIVHLKNFFLLTFARLPLSGGR
jgi:hypothetical protein